jgi:NAD-dependent DNA ligase
VKLARPGVLGIKGLLVLRAALDLKESSARRDFKVAMEIKALTLQMDPQAFQEKMEDVGNKVKKDLREFAAQQALLEIVVELEELAFQVLPEEEALLDQRENAANRLILMALKIFLLQLLVAVVVSGANSVTKVPVVCLDLKVALE